MMCAGVIVADIVIDERMILLILPQASLLILRGYSIRRGEGVG